MQENPNERPKPRFLAKDDGKNRPAGTYRGRFLNRQTPEVEWTAIKRTHDGQYQYVADEGQNSFTTEKAATFLESVYTPTLTAGDGG